MTGSGSPHSDAPTIAHIDGTGWSEVGHDHLSLEDVDTVLTTYFPRWTIESGLDRVEYRRSDDSLALTSTFDGELLVSVEPSADYTPAEDADLAAQFRLAARRGPELVDRTVLLASQPVGGYWRFADMWQILPVPGDAPQAFQWFAPHPFVLEFKYAPSGHSRVNVVRLVRRRRELALLLNVALKQPLLWQQRSTMPAWGHTPGANPVLSQLGYFLPDFVCTADELTEVQPHTPMTSFDDTFYYGRVGVSALSALDVPRSLAVTTQRFEELEGEQRQKFLNACHWFAQATSNENLCKSRDYICLITAVEALLGEAYVGKECPTCGLRKGGGPTKLFKDFLVKHAPSASKAERKDFYRTRSKLSHGEVLFADRYFLTMNHPEQWQHIERWERSRRVVQESILHWLHTEI